MIFFVEMWNATPAWTALSLEERSNYMNQIGPHIQGLIEKGTEILTWAPNKVQTDARAAYDYLAIWRFPDQETADGFQALVRQAGWYNYFDQVNLMGETNTVEHVISELVQL